MQLEKHLLKQLASVTNYRLPNAIMLRIATPNKCTSSTAHDFKSLVLAVSGKAAVFLMCSGRSELRCEWVYFMKPKATSICLIVLLVIQAGLLGYSAYVHSPTWDETGHLAAGLSHWELKRFDLYSVNPPLVRTIAAAPVYWFGDMQMDWDYYRKDPTLRTEVFLGRSMMQLNGERALKYFFWARLAVLPIALLGTWFCFLWGKSLFGHGAGVLAAFLWVFSPFVLGYGSVITPDLASAVAMLGASFAAWKWMTHPTWSASLWVAVAFSLAMLTKSIWLILPLLLLSGWGVWRLVERFVPSASEGHNDEKLDSTVSGSIAIQFGKWVFLTLLAVFLVNTFYGYQDTMRPLGDFQFVSHTLAGPAECADCGEGRGNRFRDTWLSSMPVPIPSNYLEGIDVQRRDFEAGMQNPAWKSYLFGEWRQGGWYYYYAVGLFLKIPLVTWGLILAGSVVAVLCRDDRRPPRIAIMCLWMPALAIFVVLSMNTGLNRYVRYALPVLPVLLIWASQVVRVIKPGRVWASASLLACCTLLAFVSLSGAPHWLSYFNVAAGGSARGHESLCDSNIDWGQDLLLLREWLGKHPDAANNLHLAAFSSFDPVCLGISYRLPPLLNNDATQRLLSDQRSQGPQPGWYVISKNYLVGHSMPVPDGLNRIQFEYSGEPIFQYFTEFEPIDRIGHSMLVFNLTIQDVIPVREKLGLAPLGQRVSNNTAAHRKEINPFAVASLND